MDVSAAWTLGLSILALTIAALAAAGIWQYRVAVKRRLAPAVIATVDALIPESKYVEFDGTKLHYVQAGSGPDVVLLHGIGASIFVWRFLFPLLQGRHRVTAFDLPGFGKSCKEPKRDYGLDAQSRVIAEALTKLGIERAVLVGSSMGGTIALRMASLFPSRFTKIAALAPATDSSLVPAHVRHFAVAAPLLRRALNRRTMRQLVSRVVARQALVTDEVVTAYLEPFLSDSGSGVRAFWSATSLLADRRLPGCFAGMKTRSLIIYGTRDLLVTRKSIDRLVEMMPLASLLVHDEGGHHIMEDEPLWTARTLEAFFLEES